MHYYLLGNVSEDASAAPQMPKSFQDRCLWYQKYLTLTSKVVMNGDTRGQSFRAASALRYYSESKKGFSVERSVSAVPELDKNIFLLVISNNTKDTDYTREHAEAYT